VAVTVKLPFRPTLNVAPAGLVIDGGTLAGVSVSVSVAELLPGAGSLTPAGVVTVAVLDRLPAAPAAMNALAV
jgi:hypothetical protein